MTAKELGNAIQKELTDLTECAICLQAYSDPRLLPCGHTFCLSCIRQYTDGREPGAMVNCALCKKPFFVPSSGIDELKKNFMAAKIQELELKLEEMVHRCCVTVDGEEEGLQDVAAGTATKDVPIKAKLNILLVGPTGVGKSTLINSFLTYLKYHSLEEAQQDPNFTFEIPVKLIIRDPETYEERVLGDGDENENFEEIGQSVTREPRVYEIAHGGQFIRLIDTPGVGDTLGKEVDEDNINEILKVISQYDELHAICILLKSGETRLSEGFKYCLQKLLANLHEKAQDNIVFCMTYANVSKFVPGKAVDIIAEFLKGNKITRLKVSRDTVYFVDNEIVEYMMKVKNEIEPSSDECESAMRCWKGSVEQIKRLLDYVTRPDRSPYPVTTTESLLFAKQVFRQLAEPLALIVCRGTANRLELERRRTELEELKSQMPEDNMSYWKWLFTMIGLTVVRSYELAIKTTEKRNMYCISQKCIKLNDNGIEYPICHEGCNCFRKRTCSTINWTGNCKSCGCSYRDHDRKSHEAHFDTKTDEKEFEAQLDEIKKSRDPQDAITLFNRRILRMSEIELQMLIEQNKIRNTCAKLSAFLQQTAILAEERNRDYVLRHLDGQIMQMQLKWSKQNADGLATDSLDMRTIKALLQSREEYINQIEQLVKAGQKLDSSLVKKMVNDLYSLPFYGETIKKAVDDIQAANLTTNNGIVRQVALLAVGALSGIIDRWWY